MGMVGRAPLGFVGPDQRALTLLGVLLLLLLSSRAGAYAAERAVRFDIYPFSRPLPVEGADQATDVLSDFVAALLARTGLPATIRILPARRLRLPKEAADRDFTFLPAAFESARGWVVPRSQDEVPSVPLIKLVEMPVVAVVRPDTALRSAADLRALDMIAVIMGSLGDHGYGVEPEWHLKAVPTIDDALNMLSSGRVDAVIDYAPVIDARAEALGLTEILGQRLVLFQAGIVLAATKAAANEPEAKILRDAAQDLTEDAAFERILCSALGLGVEPASRKCLPVSFDCSK